MKSGEGSKQLINFTSAPQGSLLNFPELQRNRES